MSLTRHRNCLSHGLLLLFLCLPFSYGRSQDRASVPQSRRAWLDPNVGEEYRKWLREDVVWIITDQERADFQKLVGDQQRDRFIEAFWERRNPTPGAPENAFKEEHYRRIAYANEHFAERIPGWKTDRGNIYIKYGTPDNVDRHQDTIDSDNPQQQHPDGIQQSHFAFEDWRYRYIEGIGRNVIVEFVDDCSCGEFQLSMLRPTKDHPAIRK
jgi:GWxTD domain-containing protein